MSYLSMAFIAILPLLPTNLVSPFMVNGSLRQYMNKTSDHPEAERHNLVRNDRFPFCISNSDK